MVLKSGWIHKVRDRAPFWWYPPSSWSLGFTNVNAAEISDNKEDDEVLGGAGKSPDEEGTTSRNHQKSEEEVKSGLSKGRDSTPIGGARQKEPAKTGGNKPPSSSAQKNESKGKQTKKNRQLPYLIFADEPIERIRGVHVQRQRRPDTLRDCKFIELPFAGGSGQDEEDGAVSLSAPCIPSDSVVNNFKKFGAAPPQQNREDEDSQTRQQAR